MSTRKRKKMYPYDWSDFAADNCPQYVSVTLNIVGLQGRVGLKWQEQVVERHVSVSEHREQLSFSNDATTLCASWMSQKAFRLF